MCNIETLLQNQKPLNLWKACTWNQCSLWKIQHCNKFLATNSQHQGTFSYNPTITNCITSILSQFLASEGSKCKAPMGTLMSLTEHHLPGSPTTGLGKHRMEAGSGFPWFLGLGEMMIFGQNIDTWIVPRHTQNTNTPSTKLNWNQNNTPSGFGMNHHAMIHATPTLNQNKTKLM